MSRWVDADSLIRYGKRGTLVYWEDIEDAPHIDIVRCKECRYGQDDLFHMFCAYHHHKTYADDFCNYGEVSEKPTSSERSSE